MDGDSIEVRIAAIGVEAADVKSYDLRPADGVLLPPFTAGAHVNVRLPNNMLRSFSLVNSQGERHRYVIAVGLDRNSRGGSRFMHQALRVGDRLSVSPPRNNFVLDESAPHSVLIGGGIGITPLWCMVQRLVDLRRQWTLHYCARTRGRAAFADAIGEMQRTSLGRVHFNFDEEPGGKMLDMARLLKDANPDHHYYCCGPLPMLAAFEAAAAALPRGSVHVEYFTAKDAPAAGGFTVVLARSGRTVEIPAGKTILETLLGLGMDVPFACEMGTCATCETRVLEGVPDHRDVVLSPEEKAANKLMMICCSGCIGERLVLDR